MTKEELIQFLKENLSISVDSGDYNYYSSGVRYTVKLKLNNETISEDYITVSSND